MRTVPGRTALQADSRRDSLAARRYIDGVCALLERVDSDAVAALTTVLRHAWRRDSTVFLAGNGGSAAMASHFSWDLARQTQACLPGLRTFALTDSAAAITALVNDVGAARVFADQLRVHARARDVLIWLSCSCRSPSVIAATQEARTLEMVVVGLGGFDGGTLRSECDIYLHVPSDDYGQIEAVHSALAHCVAAMLQGSTTTPAV